MPLRPLVVTGGVLAMAALLPLVLAFALTGHSDVAHGLLLGLAVGLLNNFLLARKLDRVMAGRDPWQALTRIMRRNMLLRFALIFASGAIAAQIPGIHLAGMAGGIGIYLVISLVYSSWVIVRALKKEDGSPIYG